MNINGITAREGRKLIPMTWVGLLLVLLFLLLLSPDTLFSQQPEYKVKALLLRRICRFVEWPEAVGLADSTKPFVITVFGENPFGIFLDKNYGGKRGQRIKGKKVEIRYINKIEEIAGCHLLFVSEVSRRRLTRVLEYTGEKPILSVADTPGYARRGVHINLLIERKEIIDKTKPGRKREIATATSLEINETASRRAGLVLHNSLLKTKTTKIINPYIPYRDKADQLESIARFVTWPPGLSMENTSKPFNIAVIGKNPFGDHLQDVYKKKQILKKRVYIRYISNVKEIGNAHLLFVSESMKNELKTILDSIGEKPILLVGDTEGFARQGIHVNFFYEGVKLRFEINDSAARQAGLAISWHMMKAAKRIAPILENR
ncbi:MAG: DUF4154 domain-containing protein [Candidatus Aminicenantes bacterium]|nr:DUF4154 domain-containing protein [Candidatus Aminicenantes bacterium]NIM85149.1 DUF4154 domain-containing protein [Candidatus Aminicenantes bacterium]NIN24659.1 DUF4154 domain-containing protein [Candidatus Aminicenantes bacterium]NIN48420.1 DUF4154 domain-containing protein [Candidatus Aminicenantes bacterium]NIN91323.1 DUF4154 domain-containing protein [Candidatus Aminicenantes bacterium]